MKADNLERVLATIKGNDTDREGEIYFAEFDKTIRLYLYEQNKTVDYIEKCIKTFFNWNDGLFDKLRKASFDYYRDFVEEVGMDEMPVINSSA
ncbi:MAG: hypothetical protein H7Z37_02895, partial [Pyrinomonadaceae bacterium]|nr:hypothetical protein [Pyrinomonadaceae bacterium]